MYNGSLLQYRGGVDPQIAERVGLTGLRFNRMIDENVALYDVMAMNASSHSGDSEMLGQIAVVVPQSRRALELWHDWEVEPLGVLEGTNYVGAKVEVPAVRFWRYAEERYANQQQQITQRPQTTEAVIPPNASQPFSVNSGLTVGNVAPTGPAAQAGLQTGDTIVSVNGKSVRSGDDLRTEVSAIKPGDTITLGYIRGGKEFTANITVPDR